MIAVEPRNDILHIGTGAFARSHAADYLHDLRVQGDTNWSMVAGDIRSDLTALAKRHGTYTLETVTPQGARRYKTIESICEVIPKSDSSEALIAAGTRPRTRIVSFTVTEAGYCFDAQYRLDASDPALQA